MELIYKLMPFCLPRLQFIKQSDALSCLDFGCGDGIVLRQNAAVRPDFKYYGVDVRDFSHEVPDYVTFTTYNGKTLPYPDKSFDIITVNHVFEHIKDPREILMELKRVLKKNGHIYIEVPNRRSLWGKPNGKFAGTVHFFDDPTHLRPYSQNELMELCETCGFVIINSGIARNYFHLLFSPLLMMMGVLFPKKNYYMYARNSFIGWSSYAIIKKPELETEY